MLSLDQIAIKCGTDKSSLHHGYCEIYESYFAALRQKSIHLLEIGAGGYEYPDRGGQSLNMWSEYFPKAKISCVELYDKGGLKLPARVTIYKGSEDDGAFLNGLLNEIGAPDIVINDGSHIVALTISNFEIMFPQIKAGGIYICEDAHAGYWSENYGGTIDTKAPPRSSTMNYFKHLSDYVNYGDFDFPALNGIESQIKAVHFWKEMVVVLKK